MANETPTPNVPAVVEPKPSLDIVDGVAQLRTLDQEVRFAKAALESRLLPDSITSVPMAWAVLHRGGELGFRGLAAFEFLYVVGGRVRITPDGVKALAMASGLLEDASERIHGTGDDMVARVVIKRRGMATAIIGEFSVADAKTARLWGKVGPKGPSGWVTYPKRLMLARARGFAYGDAFRDLIGGLPVRERYDLDPGERLGEEEEPRGRRASEPPKPPAPDPLLDELSGARPPKPVEAQVVEEPPFDSHAEADAAIVAEEQGDLFEGE